MTCVVDNPMNYTIPLISDTLRPAFLPALFGPSTLDYLRGEAIVYSFMNNLCSAYKGAFWQFCHDEKTDARYMYPDIQGPLFVEWANNYFSGDMTAEAAGIVATVFGLTYMAEIAAEKGSSGTKAYETCCLNYERLRTYLYAHPEVSLILKALD